MKEKEIIEKLKIEILRDFHKENRTIPPRNKTKLHKIEVFLGELDSAITDAKIKIIRELKKEKLLESYQIKTKVHKVGALFPQKPTPLEIEYDPDEVLREHNLSMLGDDDLFLVDWENCVVASVKYFPRKIEKYLKENDIEFEIKKGTKPKSNKSGLKKKSPEKTILYLTTSGDLYREPKRKYCYSMGAKSKRYKIVKLLAESIDMEYQPTSVIAFESGSKNEKVVRTEIGKIRNNIKKYLKINGKDFLQGKKDSGYRINPKYKIIMRDE